jgi:hypothetical protein
MRLRLAYHVGMTDKLIADRGTNQIAAIGIKPFLHQQVDLPQIYRTEIDRDLFSIAQPDLSFSQLQHVTLSTVVFTIHTPSTWMLCGWCRRLQENYLRMQQIHPGTTKACGRTEHWRHLWCNNAGSIHRHHFRRRPPS